MDFPLATIDQLPAHLRALRKARGLTQTELGHRLGVKQTRIADIERDPGSVSVAQMHKLLAALDTQVVLRATDGREVAPAGGALRGSW